MLTMTSAAFRLQNIIAEHYVESLAFLPMFALLLLLLFSAYLNYTIRTDLKKNMLLIIAVVISLVVQNYAEYRLAEGEVRWLARTLVSIYGYAIRPVILVLFMKLIAPDMRSAWAWVLVGVNAAVHVTALFSGICFRITETNHYMGGPLCNMCLYVSAILYACQFVMTIRIFHTHRHKETWVPVVVLAMITGAVFLDEHVGSLEQPITYLTLAIAISCVFYYFWLHLMFVREHEQSLEAEQRIQIMMTQIQPHFLNNTIATIRALCRTDAEKAGEVAEKFGEYLRDNLDSLGTVGLVPFRKELEHTRTYAEIEMVRFDNIHVLYDIQDDGFALPPLTVQPLVENAIRHGVRIREEGIVKVSSRRTGDGHEIIVWDNGIGFDTAKIDAADRTHIGIRNVRERIERISGGTMKVDSRIGEGTVVTITIPYGNDTEEGMNK